MKYRNIYLIILTIGSICFLNGEDANIRSIRMDAEKLTFSDYTFDQFLEETGSKAKFFCGYKDNYYDLDYKTLVTRVESNRPTVALFETDSGIKIRVDKNNFEKFRKVFYGYRPLEFEENRFPARFFKVKTEDNLGKGNDNKIKFYEIPGKLNSEIESPPFQDQELYYVYSIYDDGEDQWALLGADKRVTPKKNNIVGWVKYIKDTDKRINVVLWNTNMGVKPNCNDISNLDPLVFKVDENGYNEYLNYIDGEDIDRAHVIRDAAGVTKWCESYTDNKGSKMRDLPMYLEEEEIHVGVVEKANALKQDLLQFITADEMQIAVVLDATNSMRLVWDKLVFVLEEMLTKMTDGSFKNISGESITPKIKIYYYNYNPNRLMPGNDWITSPDNVREYANSMKNRISNSKDVRPDVIRTVNLALQDMGTEPTYIVLIGDASDYNTGGTDLTSVETVKAQRTENVYLGGCSVRIESDIVNQAKKYPYDSELQEYKRAYDEFSNILDVKYEVSHNELNSQNQQSLNNMGKTIAEVIKNDIMETMKVITMTKSSGSKGSFDEGLCANMDTSLSCEYLKQLHDAGLLLDDGTGSFFKEGLVLHKNKNHNLLNVDILITGDDINDLIKHLQDYTQGADTENAKYMIRAVLSVFFEMDPYNVDIDFLDRTTLKDMWEKIVGNTTVADALNPGFFASIPDITFGEMYENIEEYEDILQENVDNTLSKLKDFYIDGKNDEYILSLEPDQDGVPQKRVAYFIKQSDLSIFNGLVD